MGRAAWDGQLAADQPREVVGLDLWDFRNGAGEPELAARHPVGSWAQPVEPGVSAVDLDSTGLWSTLARWVLGQLSSLGWRCGAAWGLGWDFCWFHLQ